MDARHPPHATAVLAVAAALLAGGAPALAQAPAARTFLTQSATQQPRALEPSVLRERRVDLDPLAMGGPATAPAERLFLDLFPDVSYVAIRERVVRHDGGLTWHGRLNGLPLSRAVFAVADGAFAGHITSPLGQFMLAPAPAGGYLIQQVTFEGTRPDDAMLPPAGAVGAAAPPDLGLTQRAASAASAVVDLLVVYTTAARLEAGGAAPIEAAIAVAVGLADAALRAAGTGGVRLAGVREVGYVASNDMFVTMSHLQNGADGLLDEVHAMRQQYAADVVTLVTDSVDPQYGGLGYISPGLPAFAFNIVERNVLNGLVLAHEVGHNLGLHHDWYVTTEGGVRPSSKGYISLAGRFGTIMARPDHCAAAGVSCTQLTAFSNPAGPHQGFATGVAVGTSTSCAAGNAGNPPCDADSASTLAETTPIVAAYRLSSRLDGGQSLLPGQQIWVQAASCRLEYQEDGNLVAYDDGVPYYASATGGTMPGQAAMQADGNFVLYDAVGAPVWATGTGGNPGAHLEIQQDCNVVLYSARGAPLWASGVP